MDDDGRGEDRELGELLSELRVVLPGTTVLFGFLLSLPFAARFGGLTEAQQVAFFIAFMSTALAIVFLTGEVTYHRLRGRPYDKRRMIATATRQTVTAAVLLAIALVAVVFLVTDVLYAATVAFSLAGGVGLLAALAWFAIPLFRRRRASGEGRRGGADR